MDTREDGKSQKTYFQFHYYYFPNFIAMSLQLIYQPSQEKTAFLNISINLLNGSVATD